MNGLGAWDPVRINVIDEGDQEKMGGSDVGTKQRGTDRAACPFSRSRQAAYYRTAVSPLSWHRGGRRGLDENAEVDPAGIGSARSGP